MVALVITLVLALAVLGKGVQLRVSERRLAARLVAVPARVTNQGTIGARRELPSSDEPRHETVYTGTWEYAVGGRTYQGSHESNAPVFRATDMPPATITVHVDRDNPAQSRLFPGADASGARAWFIFAGVILAVGGAIVAIGGL